MSETATTLPLEETTRGKGLSGKWEVTQRMEDRKSLHVCCLRHEDMTSSAPCGKTRQHNNETRNVGVRGNGYHYAYHYLRFLQSLLIHALLLH